MARGKVFIRLCEGGRSSNKSSVTAKGVNTNNSLVADDLRMCWREYTSRQKMCVKVWRDWDSRQALMSGERRIYTRG